MIKEKFKELYTDLFEPRIYWALAHELGHVFGVPHRGSFNDLMSSHFLEWVYSEPIVPAKSGATYQSGFLRRTTLTTGTILGNYIFPELIIEYFKLVV